MTKLVTTGKLVVFEGIDGAGKSTLSHRVTTLLQEDSCQVVLTHEPGGTPAGRAIRTLIKDRVARAVPLAECLLFAADKALHVNTVVMPALQRGTVVLSDRMSDSLYAYQGWGNGVDLGIIDTLTTWTMQGLMPDLTVYLVIDYATAQQRINKKSRPGEIDSYDQEGVEFFRRVARGYEALYANRPNVMRIDATQNIETNAHLVYQRICALMGSDGTR
jgi:dTMP kinase